MISIIITAYNVEKTINKAIDSCLALTYKDLEIIVVNDYSTDSTLSILQEYQDPRIKIVNLPVNMGAGMGRLTGVKYATGEYTTFLDGDDWLKEDYIETLYNAAITNNAQIVSSGIVIVAEDKEIALPHIAKILEGEEVLIYNDFWIKRFLNNKLVHRSLWEKVTYSSRRYIEDTLTSYFLNYYCNKMVLLDYCGYYYYQNSNSLVHTATAVKDLIYRALCAKDISVFTLLVNSERQVSALLAFIFRIQELNKHHLTEEEQLKYSNELSELFCYFLNNVEI